MSGLIARIQQDIQKITTNGNEFAIPVLFSITNGVTVLSKTCNAIAVKHHLQFSDTGRAINGKTARISVSELALISAGFPTRDTNNNVNLISSRVTWTDISGVQATYVIREQYPNEVTGHIVCFLGDYISMTPPGRIIIGWIVSKFVVNLVLTVDPTQKQTLANGDIINTQYVINTDGTITIPYLIGYNVLTPFIIDYNITNPLFDNTTGKFNNSAYGGFEIGNVISFNASIPIWQS